MLRPKAWESSWRLSISSLLTPPKSTRDFKTNLSPYHQCCLPGPHHHHLSQRLFRQPPTWPPCLHPHPPTICPPHGKTVIFLSVKQTCPCQLKTQPASQNTQHKVPAPRSGPKRLRMTCPWLDLQPSIFLSPLLATLQPHSPPPF